MLGAGLDLSESYLNLSLRDASYTEMFRIQEEVGSFKAAVLVDHGYVWGKVGTEILVLPNLGKEYAEAALKPDVKGIVCETGVSWLTYRWLAWNVVGPSCESLTL